MGSTGIRTLVVGIDAACLPVLDPLLDDGSVPTLAGLVDDGACAPLESQIPPWTPSAWPSIYTGMNPGKHGVFDFLSFDGYDWEVVDATSVRERTVWELLDHHGLSSVVVNAPVTHPPRPFDGALVPGYMAPEDPTCHPEGLLEELREAIGDYRVYPDDDAPAPAKYTEVVGMRGAAFRELADRFDPDFGFLQFQVTDTVFHEHPGEDDLVRAVYAAVDDELAATLAACDPGNVLVVSDHGMGPYGGVEFRVNELLREAGHVEAVRGGEGMPTWSTVREQRLKAAEAPDDADDASLARAAAAAAARVGLTTQRIEAVLDRLGLTEVAAAHAPAGLVQAASEQVDFPASTAYARSRTECGVRINLAGREPEGVVDADEYETVRRELMDALAAVRTPGGEPVFEDVAPREAYFHGPHAGAAVDVVTVPADFEHFLSTKLAGARFGEPTEPWNHKRAGVVAARGPALAEADLSAAHVFDVAPTVLSTFDLPADERMDGTSWRPAGVAERAYPSFEPAAPAEGSTADEDVEERLADLGYLE